MNFIKSLYIHVPYCKHLCNYCDFYKHKFKGESDLNGFEEHLSNSFEALKSFLIKNNQKVLELDTLYLGGGTPSLWGKRGANFLKDTILKDWPLSKNAEVTLEVDPDSYKEEDLFEFIKLGVSRVSVGMQSFDDGYLKLLDRKHSVSQCEKLFSFLQKNNVSFTVDFLLGVPDSENKRNVISELDKVLKFNPDHLSLYILTTRSNYPLKNRLPSDEWVEKEYLSVSNYLVSQGFEHYEVSNFAKNKKYSKHNLAYWEHKSVVALGANATGFINLKDKAIRYQWKSSKSEMTEEYLDEEALKLEELYLSMRTKWGVHLEKYYRGNLDRILYKLRDQEKNGLCHISGDKLILTPRGFLMQDTIMDEIFKVTT